MKKRVLITGATGFLGSHCLRLLTNSDYDVFAVSRLPRSAVMDGIKWIQADLLDPAHLSPLISESKPTHMLHLAWDVSQRDYRTSPDNELWLHSGIQLMKAFAKSGGERLVMAGTCAEYDWSNGLCSEITTPLRPASAYGQSKNALQEELRKYSKGTGLSSAWGRIFYVFGPGEPPDRLIPSVIVSLLKREEARCTHGDQIRDFLPVQDVADAFIHLLESDIQGPVNIASGQAISIKDIVTRIGQALHSEHLLRFGAIPSRQDEAPKLVADVRRLSEEVGWQPKQGLTAGLETTIAWWRRELAEEQRTE
ncbi:MAG: NAD-dependent epimerase/dehydratase family protein [Thermodesulfobacteriota bacterium]